MVLTAVPYCITSNSYGIVMINPKVGNPLPLSSWLINNHNTNHDCWQLLTLGSQSIATANHHGWVGVRKEDLYES